MRDIRRIDPMIEKLRALWHAYPDLRLGQLVENLAKHGAASTRGGTTNLFYMEDTEMGFAIEDAIDNGLMGKKPPVG